MSVVMPATPPDEPPAARPTAESPGAESPDGPPAERANTTDDAGWLRSHGLSIVLTGLFLLFLVGQALAGHRVFNEDQVAHGGSTVGLGTYLTTAHFGEAVFENWESEFLQMGAYILLTVWLFQRGSSESKSMTEPSAVDEPPEAHRDDPDVPWPVRRGGAVLWLFRNSLSIAFLTLFALSWAAHAVTGSREYSADQVAHGSAPVTAWEYLHRSQFWFESMQNWQSEFLAVACIVVLSVHLRQHGSPESKPVHAPHHATGSG